MLSLVTGASSGIGLQYATQLARDYHSDLLLVSNQEKELAEVAQNLKNEYGVNTIPHYADLSKPEAADLLFAYCKENGLVVDVLINNAQASASGVSIAQHTTEQFDLAIYSGLYATFYYMKACYPYLKETQGTVINFASGAGLFGNFGQCSYAAAKEGVRGLSRVAATEWAKDGINVNVICPLAWTAQLENFEKAYPEAFKANVKMPPAGHYGDPEKEIASVCVHLASPDMKYLTGETLTLEGGMGLRP